MSGHEAHAFWVTAPGRGEIRSQRLPVPATDEVRVRTLYSGLSRGTERLVFQGAVPVSEYGRMRAPFQTGEFPAPVKYGYANVGVVESGPAALLGQTVFCLYPHQTHYVVPASAVHLLPASVPPERAILAANLETAINGLWDAGLQVGDRVAVVGAGVVGALVAWLASRMVGCEAVLIDVRPERARIAERLGLEFLVADEAPKAWAQRADCVFHTSATEPGLRLSLALAAFEATVVEMSWYGTRPVTLPLGEAFHALRLTLKSSQVGAIPAARRARWTPERRLSLALSLLSDPAVDVLVTGESPFATLPDVMARVAAGEDGLCHRFSYS